MTTETSSPIDGVVMPSPMAVIDRMSAALARNWGWVLARGILGIAVGIMAMVQPLATIGALLLLFAVFSIADGVVAIAAAIRAARQDERWGWFLFHGVVDLGAAAVVLFMPVLAVKVFLFVMAFWAMLGGIAMLVAAFKLKIDHGRWWLVIGGALSILWGVLLLLQPAIGALVLTFWFGIYALVFGVFFVVIAFTLRRHHKRLS